LLPEIARMTLEGYSNRTIAQELGVPRRTVDRWILELRQEWSARANRGAQRCFP
jgi:DNA-directed RNA polymerase specialized sigma24 family protein